MSGAFYSQAKLDYYLYLMLNPDIWPGEGKTYGLKRWGATGLEFGALTFEGGRYQFLSDGGTTLEGDIELPRELINQGWVAD